MAALLREVEVIEMSLRQEFRTGKAAEMDG
jgi:hypothetical protein